MPSRNPEPCSTQVPTVAGLAHAQGSRREALRDVEMEVEEKVIKDRGFLCDAQRTENLSVAIARDPVIQDFTGLFASFGSCFAHNLQRVMTGYGFRFWFERDISAHYSIESMANAIAWVVDQRPHDPGELYRYADPRGGFCAYRYHFKKRFFCTEEQILARMAEVDAACREALETCEHLVITLGTARLLRFEKDDDLINGAVGIPKHEWYTTMSTVEDNVAQLERLYAAVRKLRPDHPPTLFFTISPQRYLFAKEVMEMENISPFVDNQLSKSILRVALSEFMARHPGEPIIYFPAYEIIMDELRQYETLSTYDFMHINQDLTPKFVVKRFLQSYAADQVLEILPLIERARLMQQSRANLVAGGLDVGNDPFFAQQVLALLDDITPVTHLDKAPSSLAGPVLDLAMGCKEIVSLLCEANPQLAAGLGQGAATV